jgi:hypothetical protein
MGGVYHLILFHEFLCYCGGMQSGVISMNEQSSTWCASLFTSPFRERSEYFALGIAAIKFAFTRKNAYYVKFAGIRDDSDHSFFASNRNMCPLGHFFTVLCQMKNITYDRTQIERL